MKSSPSENRVISVDVNLVPKSMHICSESFVQDVPDIILKSLSCFTIVDFSTIFVPSDKAILGEKIL
jgi:hypothetical protein